uniref:GATA-type domain-containing protein n=1 Tax=Compsopogon caeruleus TaxID=31354 RepID=A0A6T6AV47_9RHOD|mmetsp:Transcript_12246/g.24976  ORF Transcript_12246/g.24976 Transcript_12246/m.24976 type:complete len:505 (+) Transcript_12246:564-2078(+)|eukprot:CAMPEP_0184678684 /NCGR_PEP_ID=MMETSP0312-20130426/1463_1 /TAXON_ID=31354 /ORGANISM="Compsopogon coeruleus, Strain SAG 36.94" /LENGTH=504 /DNA_ID=CAMNT_0027127599 /DNA_START=500 /DNA_END=2014 /DNA_ORIENTATION=-
MAKGSNPERLRCSNCNKTETPLWRSGPEGPKTLCNACGVRWKKGKLVLGSTRSIDAERRAQSMSAFSSASAVSPVPFPSNSPVPTSPISQKKTHTAKLKGAIKKESNADQNCSTLSKVGRKPTLVKSSSFLSSLTQSDFQLPSQSKSGDLTRKRSVDVKRSWRHHLFPLSTPSSPEAEQSGSYSSSEVFTLDVRLGEEEGSDPYFAAEVDEALSRCRILEVEREIEEGFGSHDFLPSHENLSNQDAAVRPPVCEKASSSAPRGRHLTIPTSRALSPLNCTASRMPNERPENEAWGADMGTRPCGADFERKCVSEDRKKVDVSKTKVISASSSIGEPAVEWNTPDSSTLSKPLLMGGDEVSRVSEIRKILLMSSGVLPQRYLRCVQWLANLCSKLPNTDAKDYVKAFAYNQTGFVVGREAVEDHLVALRGFYCDRLTYCLALGAFREVFLSFELVECRSEELVNILVSDVCRTLPALTKGENRCVSEGDAPNLDLRKTQYVPARA